MTPCLGAIKSWRPDIRITVVSEPLASPLLEDHALIDQLVVSGEGLYSRAGLVRALRHGHFDVAFNLHGGTTATIIAALSGAMTTVGYQGYRYSRLLKMRAPSPDRLLGRQSLHSVEQQLALLCWAGVPWPASPKLSLAVSADALAAVRRRLKDLGIDSASSGSPGYAVLSPAASIESKRWPAASFAEVADYLKRRYQLPSVVIAGRGEEAIATQIAALSKEGANDFTGLDLKELVGLIAHNRIFIGNDSGPMHIAAAFNRALVAVFGASSPTVWSPWTRGPLRVLIGPPSIQRQNGEPDSGSLESSPTAGVPDISRISIQEVIAAVDEVMVAQTATQPNEDSATE
jgi:ADP-heptose:LPS heptosyltransferase